MEYYVYAEKFKSLIAKERNSEIKLYSEEIENLTAEKREHKGRCLTNMIRQSNSKLENEGIFRFVKKTNGENLPHNEFTIGSNVLVSIDNPITTGLKGIIEGKSLVYIDILLDKQSNILNDKILRIDLFVNDTTYKTQNQILDNMRESSGRKMHIREVLLGNEKPTLGKQEEIDYYDKTLNPSQKLAVKYAVAEEDFYLIQGPPGTGKTKTSIEIIRQHIKRGKKVLVSADSNMAVDNIMLGLIKHLDVMRLGDSPKMLEEIKKHTFSRIIEKNIKYFMVTKNLETIKNLRTKQRNYIVPNKNSANGLSYFQIMKLAERKQSDFGLSLETIESMTNWIKIQEEVKELQMRVDKVRNEIVKDIIERTNIICTTNSNANHDVLRKIEFDLVLIDEAGQSTEPSCLIPISKAKKVVLVGDHKQLPPTILSEDAKELSISLFERMIDNLRFAMLDTQYRMNPLINEFSSKEFYSGRLMSYEDTKNHVLAKKVFEKPVIFINCNGKEEKHKGFSSYYNLDEIEVVFDLISKYAKADLVASDIGVISPYSGQVAKLKERMPFIEVNTIDGFQGREKKLIIISLVRSNDEGSIGFLKDYRRLNVALTRAEYELVVIGNRNTISNDPVYKRFLEFVKTNGTYVEDSNV